MQIEPPRMQHLPRDKRGYPIPVILFRDREGCAHFTVNDEAQRQAIIRDDLCQICGGKLLRGRWFIGGALSAFDPNGAYLDPPMHDECLHYALQTCPYLAAPRYARLIGAQTIAEPVITGIDAGHVNEIRPDVFVAVMAIGQRPLREGSFVRYLKPCRPYRKIEYWQHGQLLESEDRPT